MNHFFRNGLSGLSAAMLLLAFQLPSAIAALASNANQGAEVAADKIALAAELALLTNSSGIVIGDSESDGRMRPIWHRLLSGDSDFGEFEKEHPGTINELLDAVLPIINSSLAERLPILQQRQAALYVNTFDVDELRLLLRFYRSPTGEKLLRLVEENIHTNNVEAAMQSSKDMSFDVHAALADMKETGQAIIPQFSATDKAMLELLAQSSVGPKLRQIAQQTQQNALVWYDEYLPGEEEKIDAAMEAVIARKMEANE